MSKDNLANVPFSYVNVLHTSSHPEILIISIGRSNTFSATRGLKPSCLVYVVLSFLIDESFHSYPGLCLSINISIYLSWIQSSRVIKSKHAKKLKSTQQKTTLPILPHLLCPDIFTFVYLSKISIYLSTYLSTYLPIDLSIYQSTYLSIYLSGNLPAYIATHTHWFLNSTCVFTYIHSSSFCISQDMLVAGEAHLWLTKVGRLFSTQPCSTSWDIRWFHILNKTIKSQMLSKQLGP